MAKDQNHDEDPAASISTAAEARKHFEALFTSKISGAVNKPDGAAGLKLDCLQAYTAACKVNPKLKAIFPAGERDKLIVAAVARLARAKENASGKAGKAGKSAAEAKPVEVVTLADAIAALKPPDYLIRGVVKRRSLYSITAPTGHGKTAILVRTALCVATSQPLGDHAVKPGRALYLIGENPEDTLPRFKVAAYHMEIDLAAIADRVLVTTERFDLETVDDLIHAKVEAFGPVDLVVIDTGPSFFIKHGDDQNDNDQMGRFAAAIREGCAALPGAPTALVAMHPNKTAGRDALIPRGGSAFLAEVDGNLTVWSENHGATCELHWQGKFRGPEFEAMRFRNVKTAVGSLLDADKQPMVSVYSRPMTAAEIDEEDHVAHDADQKVLLVICQAGDKGIGITDIAHATGMVSKNGEPRKSSVHDICKRLEEQKLIEQVLGKRRATAKGKKLMAGTSKPAAADWSKDLD